MPRARAREARGAGLRRMSSSLSAPLFAVWSGFVKDHFGLSYGPVESELLGEKLWARAQEAGFVNLLDYYYYLRYDAGSSEELDALADALVVGESYLFRELAQIEAAVDGFIAPAVAARGRARVWSAACAAGEEPLTLAMALARRGLLDRVQIIASDLSRRALARAAQHTWSRRALRSEPLPEYRRFLEVTDDKVRVSPSLATAIEWRRFNLVGDDRSNLPRDLDVIFCRNVMIYFDDATVTATVARLTEALRPGGALFVGVSESLLRYGVGLVCEEHDGVFVYRKAPVSP